MPDAPAAPAAAAPRDKGMRQDRGSEIDRGKGMRQDRGSEIDNGGRLGGAAA